MTAWALPYDFFIFYSWLKATEQWPADERQALMIALATWTFVFSKTVKLWGHFFRYPADVVFIPVYIAFGYFHGCIKFWGLLTLNAVSTRNHRIISCILLTLFSRLHGVAEMVLIPTTASA